MLEGLATILQLLLQDNGIQVLAVDSNEATIDSIKDRVAQAVCLQITDEEDLRAIGMTTMDIVIVAMGANFAESILITALLKQNLKIKRVITRSINKTHEIFSRRSGADGKQYCRNGNLGYDLQIRSAYRSMR